MYNIKTDRRDEKAGVVSMGKAGDSRDLLISHSKQAFSGCFWGFEDDWKLAVVNAFLTDLISSKIVFPKSSKELLT